MQKIQNHNTYDVFKYLIIFILCFYSISTSIAVEYRFGDNLTSTNILTELDKANSELQDYLSDRYGIDNQKRAKEFKFQVCGAMVYDCYYTRNEKYFIANKPSVNRHGSFYFGLLQNDRVSNIVNALGWCESNYNPNIVSGDGGYGIFQITPSAIGDPSIRKNQLLNSDYNTQYGIFLLSKLFKNAQQKYSKYNKTNSGDFIQYFTLRGYNGGQTWLDRMFERLSDKQLEHIFTGDYIKASKVNGRFVCFEKVNIVYPLKIYKTSDTISRKAF